MRTERKQEGKQPKQRSKENILERMNVTVNGGDKRYCTDNLEAVSLLPRAVLG